jgi:hypothetical protein
MERSSHYYCGVSYQSSLALGARLTSSDGGLRNRGNLIDCLNASN